MEKIIDIEERIPTLKKRRVRRTNRKFSVLIVVFIFVLAVLLYFQSPYSDIKNINVNGAQLVSDSYYIEGSTLTKGQSMWDFKVADVEKTLKHDKWIKSVDVQRKWLRTVNIEVKEWRKVAYLESDSTYYPLLENGEKFEQQDVSAPIDAPIFVGFTDEKVIEKLVKQLAKLEPEVLALVSQINTNTASLDPNAIKLFMNDGYEVRAIISTLANKMNYYPSMVVQLTEKEKGIIDLEVGSFFRPFNDEYNQLDLQITDKDSEVDSSAQDGEQEKTVEGEVAEDEQQED
ncbi:MAG: FtsQ-type POTRA domain-containing protein [Lysinibacillus sp.]